jgi:O-antigen ligase
VSTVRDRLAGRALDLALGLFAVALPLSIAATEIALGIAIVAWLATRPWRRAGAPGVGALGLVTLALAGTWLLASATSVEPVASLIHARKLYSIVIVFLLADWGRDEMRAARFTRLLFAGGILTCAIGLFRFARSPGALKTWDGLQATFSNAMTSGNVIVMLTLGALAWALWPGRGRGGAMASWATFGLFLVSLLATLRRSAWLALLAGCALLVAMRRARMLLLLPLALAVVVALAPAHFRARMAILVDPTEYTGAGRISLWKSGFAAWQDRPITGHGLQDMLGLIARYRRPDATFEAGHFHNNWVQIAVATGTVGLLAYGTWMALAGWLLWRRWRLTGHVLAAAGLAVWLGFQVHGLFDWSFGDAEVANQFFAWVGLGLAAGNASQRPR